MKKLNLIFAIIIFVHISVIFAFPQLLYAIKENFKINKSLSNYLDAQGFKFGISRSEAIKLYGIDSQYGSDAFVSRLVKNGLPIAEGFFKFSFNKNNHETNNLYTIEKCIAVERNLIPDDIAIEFQNKYNLPTNPMFFPVTINHHGRYIGIRMKKIGGQINTLIITAWDFTEDEIKSDKEQKSQQDTTERLKRKF